MDSALPQLLILLKSKNRCLERFHGLSQEFLERTSQGGFATLEAALPPFEAAREAVVRAIGLYERQIEREARRMEENGTARALEPGLREAARALMNEGENTLAEVLRTDERVVARIEGGRAELQSELAANERNQAAMDKLKKFRSSWVAESGEELDRKL